MSVSGCFEQICIGVDDLAAKPTLEQMAPAAVAPVERVGVRTMNNMDCSRNVGSCGLQNEMEVSGHQGIGEKPQFLRPDSSGKKRKVGVAVVVVGENVRTIVPTSNHVVRCPGKGGARWTCHDSLPSPEVHREIRRCLSPIKALLRGQIYDSNRPFCVAKGGEGPAGLPGQLETGCLRQCFLAGACHRRRG